MTDVFDQATEREEKDRALCLQVRMPEGPKPTGYCLNCGPDVPLEAGLRWCDTNCRDDWQLRQKK